MKEIFDHAYTGVCDAFSGFVDFLTLLGNCAVVVFVYVTIPLWFIPYAILKKRKAE